MSSFVWHHRVIVVSFSGCDSKGLDLVFVLDGSGSIGLSDFRQTLQFVKDTVNNYEIGPDQTRVGVIQYSSSVIHEFALDTYNTKNDVINAVQRISYMVRNSVIIISRNWLIICYFNGVIYHIKLLKCGVSWSLGWVDRHFPGARCLGRVLLPRNKWCPSTVSRSPPCWCSPDGRWFGQSIKDDNSSEQSSWSWSQHDSYRSGFLAGPQRARSHCQPTRVP